MVKSKVLKSCVLVIISSVCCFAQIRFQSTAGGAGEDRAWSIVQTPDGGYAAAGETGSFGAGGTDFYILKLNSALTVQWSKTIGGSQDDAALSFIQTTDGGYALAGYTSSFGTVFENDMMIVKLNSAGNLEWMRTIRGTGDELVVSLIQTSDGGFALAGHTDSFGAGDFDCFIVKLDSSGAFQWSRVIGGPDIDFGYSIKQTSDGGYAVAGYSWSFGLDNWDMFIVKLNSAGNIQWSRIIGGTETDAAYSIIQTSDGGYVVCGYTISFGAGYVDMYFVKLDASGGLQWSRTAGGAGTDVAYSIIQTTDGGFAAGGYTFSFGSGLADVCIVKLNAGGTLQWSKMTGGTLFDDCWSINQTTDSGYILAGRTSSFGAGNNDMYFARLGSDGNTCGNFNNAPLVQNSGGTITAINPSIESISPLVLSPTPVVGSGGTLSVLCSVVGIQPVTGKIPQSYGLSQNYPNPFNPTTKIRFDIPLLRGVSEEQGVLLVIYDILGKEIATLVNEQLQPGSYEAEWDAYNYPSGVYFYRLTSDNYVDTRKMLLVK